MVRRKGIYEVTVIGKPLVCLFCEEKKFSHREVYLKLTNHEPGVQKKKLTLQSFSCIKCAHEMKFEEHKNNGVSTIEYVQVGD